METNRKFLVPVALVSIALFAGAVYAFTSLTVTTTLNVKEPLSITGGVATGDLGLDSVTCTIAGDSLSATCSGDVFAGDIGGITVTVANAGHQAITVTPSATSSSGDVTVAAPSASLVPSAGFAGFAFDISVSPSATTPETVTVTMSFAR